MAQTLDEPELHRSAHAGHDDRDRGRRLPCGLSHCRGPSDDHLYVEPDELCREPGEAVHMAVREPGLDHEVPPFHPSQSLETLAERVHRWIRGGRSCAEHADAARLVGRLCAGVRRRDEKAEAEKSSESRAQAGHAAIFRP